MTERPLDELIARSDVSRLYRAFCDCAKSRERRPCPAEIRIETFGRVRDMVEKSSGSPWTSERYERALAGVRERWSDLSE